MRAIRLGIGSAAALALLAGTAGAQQTQFQQRDKQMGAQTSIQYQDAGEWHPANFVPELSDALVILKSETDQHKATVHILHGQVKAKLDDQEVSQQQVQKRGDQLRLLDDEGETIAEFTLPDLQMVRQAQLMQREQFEQPGVQERQLGIQERHFGVQDQWRDDQRFHDGRQYRDQQRFQDQRHQEDWRFRDQQRFDDRQMMRDDQRRDRPIGVQEDRRFRDRDQHIGDMRQDQWRDRPMGVQEDRRFRDRDQHIGDMRQDQWRDRPMDMQEDWRFRDHDREPHIGDMRHDFQRDRTMMRPSVEEQLGIAVSPASTRELRQTRHQQGLVIEHVQRGSPLDNYGVRSGDIIVSIDGRPATHSQLQRTITRVDERDTVRMTLLRDGREGTFNLRGHEIADRRIERDRFQRDRTDRFDQRRFQDDRRVLGVQDPTMRTPVIGVQMQEARRAELQRAGARYDTGIRITDVQPGSPADRAGLRSGDIIVEIDDQPHVTPDDLRQELAMTRPGDRLNLTVIRGNRERNINLRITDDRSLGSPEPRYRDDFRRDQRFEEPSRQERLFRQPGQVPPGPDEGISRPSFDEPRWEPRRDTDTWDNPPRRDHRDW